MNRTETAKRKYETIDLAYMALGAVLIALCSWISIPAVVPFTMQTFASVSRAVNSGRKERDDDHRGIRAAGSGGTSRFLAVWRGDWGPSGQHRRIYPGLYLYGADLSAGNRSGRQEQIRQSEVDRNDRHGQVRQSEMGRSGRQEQNQQSEMGGGGRPGFGAACPVCFRDRLVYVHVRPDAGGRGPDVRTAFVRDSVCDSGSDQAGAGARSGPAAGARVFSDVMPFPGQFCGENSSKMLE